MANPAARLPQEIITDILYRLPAKSIGQFRCVSKSWRALLCSPEFIKKHLTRHAHDQEKLLLISDSNSLFTLTLSKAANGVSRKLSLSQCQDNWVAVVGSCNGLALVIDRDGSKYFINPTTREHVEVSKSPLPLEALIRVDGFGYDCINDDYKIVTLSYYDRDNQYEPDCVYTSLDVYTAKMNSWKRLGTSPYNHAIPVMNCGKYLNGALHWLARSTTNSNAFILAFNLTTEEFEELPVPDKSDKQRCVFNKLVILGGFLCMMIDDHFSENIDLWMMKEYGIKESWTRFSLYGAEYHGSNLLCLLEDEELFVRDGNYDMIVQNLKDDCMPFEFEDGNEDSELMEENLKEPTFRYMVIDGTPPEFQDGVTFIESLVSPNFNNWNEKQNSSHGVQD